MFINGHRLSKNQRKCAFYPALAENADRKIGDIGQEKPRQNSSKKATNPNRKVVGVASFTT